jgi:hypothetical protein
MGQTVELRWLKEAATDAKLYVGMVVGWQTVIETINATVTRFNAKLLERMDDRQHALKVIAAKQSIIAALRELRRSLEKWHAKLAQLGALSDESKALWKKLHSTLERIDQFKDLRNCAFQFGDFLEDPNDLAVLYEGIKAHDITELNKMLHALHDFGLRLRADAMVAIEKLKQR